MLIMRVNVTLACTECGDRNYITNYDLKKQE
ncbi:50S ribosomal protein L33 [Staphylococcus haemolyticus]|nr:50S ribosomal protein L33 [Staphylococcus haemolyticus]